MKDKKLPVRYAWVITKDHIADRNKPEGTNDNAVGVIGPRNPGLGTREEIENHPQAKHFRMFDDDGNLTYAGYFVPDKNSSDFEPLEDFGTPNAGCTEIQYLDNGKWKTL